MSIIAIHKEYLLPSSRRKVYVKSVDIARADVSVGIFSNSVEDITCEQELTEQEFAELAVMIEDDLDLAAYEQERDPAIYKEDTLESVTFVLVRQLETLIEDHTRATVSTELFNKMCDLIKGALKKEDF